MDDRRRTCCRRRTLLEICLLVILAFLLLSALLWYFLLPMKMKECDTPECIRAANKFNEFIDRSVDPCKNFYNFACGNFINHYAIEKSVSSILEEHQIKVDNELRKITMESISKSDTHSLALLKQLYSSCMNLTDIDEYHDKSIKDIMENLGGWPVTKGRSWSEQNFHWVDITVKARKLGLKYNWFIDITTEEVSGHILPKLSYPVFLEPTIDDELRSYYLHLMIATAVYFGAPPNMSLVEMDAVIEFEEKLIKISDNVLGIDLDAATVVEPIVEIQNRWPEFNWLKLIQNITMTKKIITDDFKVVNKIENYMTELEKLLRVTPKRVQANYFIWRTLHHLSSLFSKGLRNQFEKFDLIMYKEYTDRTEICMAMLNTELQHVVESEYVRRHTSTVTQKNAEILMKSLKDVLVKAISESPWMDYETKNNGINKVTNVVGTFGGPSIMFDPIKYDEHLKLDKFEFQSTDVVEMIHQLKLHTQKIQFSQIYDALETPYKVVDPKWDSIHSKYNLMTNNLMITAPILQDYFYNEKRPNYLNYGMLGFIMSRELAHGFDASNVGYKNPNKALGAIWITPQSYDRLEQILKCLTDERSRFSNGEFLQQFNDTINLVENYSDLVGVDTAYLAYQDFVKENGREEKLPGLDYTSNQLFWIQTSTLMCQAKESDMGIEQVESGNDISATSRVIGSLRNSKYFAEDFDCPVNSEMNPKHKCHVF